MSWIQVGKKDGQPVAVCRLCGWASYVPTKAHLKAFAVKHQHTEAAPRRKPKDCGCRRKGR